MTRPALLKRAEWAVAILLSAVATTLLIVRVLHAGGLWRDECGTVQLATMPRVSDVVELFDHQTFPPLLPLIVRIYVTFFGQNDTAFRIFGLLAGVVFLVAIWFSAHAFHQGLPLLSLSLFALSPVFLTWGTTVSGYGLGAAFIILAFVLTAKLLQARTPLLILSVFAAALFSQQFVISNLSLALAIEVTAMAVALIHREFKTAAILGTLALINVLVGVGYLRIYSTGDWRIVLQQTRSLPDLWRQFTQSTAESWLGLWTGRICFVAIVIAAAWQVVRTPIGHDNGGRKIASFALIVLILAPVAYFAALFGTGYRTQPWHYLLLLALLPAAMDMIAVVLPNGSWLRVARLGLAIFAAVMIVPSAWRAAQIRSTNIDIVADRLTAEAKPHDFIVLAPWQLGISFNHYYRGKTPWTTVPTIADHRIHRYDLMMAKMSSPDPIGDILESIRSTLESGNRVWFVGEMRLPNAGQVPSLPPAPHSAFGWNNSAYSEAWLEQVTTFARSHATQGQHVDLPNTGPVNQHENAPLMILEGWQ